MAPDLIVQTGAEAAARLVESTFGLDLRPRLSEVAVPAIVIHGALDQLAPGAQENASELANLLRAELHLLDGAGHLPLFSRRGRRLPARRLRVPLLRDRSDLRVSSRLPAAT